MEVRHALGGDWMKGKRGRVLPDRVEERLLPVSPLLILVGIVGVFLPGLGGLAVTADVARAKAVLAACTGWGIPALPVASGAFLAAPAWWKVGLIPPGRVTEWLSRGMAPGGRGGPGVRPGAVPEVAADARTRQGREAVIAAHGWGPRRLQEVVSGVGV